MVRENVVLVVEVWDPFEREWERHRCQAADWQQRRHSTGSRQRLELDYRTALSASFVRGGKTVSRILWLDHDEREP
jgi:hypothetical protein